MPCMDCLERFRRALEAALHGGRNFELALHAVRSWSPHRPAPRLRRQVERHRHRRELAEMVDRKRLRAAADRRRPPSAARATPFGRRREVERQSAGRVLLILRQAARGSPSIGRPGSRSARSALAAEGGAERNFDLLRRDAERGGAVAVDRDVDRRRRQIEIAVHIDEHRHWRSRVAQTGGSGVELVQIDVLHRVLVLRLACSVRRWGSAGGSA